MSRQSCLVNTLIIDIVYSSKKAAFLGDANFPALALEYYRDGRQILIQNLYEKYSSLAFTRAEDRAVAILGLQKRLERSLKSRAEYGIFAAYTHRGLLWQSGEAGGMKKIVQPTGRYVPTWSWLSKQGLIRYMGLDFDEINWERDYFKSPFTCQHEGEAKSSILAREQEDLTTIFGQARRLCISISDVRKFITFDVDQEYNVDTLCCLIIGWDKTRYGMRAPKFHVLIIRRIEDTGVELFERVGVGSIERVHLASEAFLARVG